MIVQNIFYGVIRMWRKSFIYYFVYKYTVLRYLKGNFMEV